MGMRLTRNLKERTGYSVAFVEPGAEGLARLAVEGIEPTEADEALSDVEVVILALPDARLGAISHDVVPKMAPGAMLVTLDPAAAHAGVLAHRDDLAYFVTHPCHPPVFNDEVGEAKKDFFGGVLARQAIVCALMQGSEDDYVRGAALAEAMYAPVMRSHRVTVEQMAILEPAMAETVTACCITIIREAMDEAIRRGVPADAARDFMLGHVNIPLAIVFGEVNSPFSDGAKLIIEHGRREIFREDWKKVFEPESVRDQVRAIVENRTTA
jgi:Arc/MetJ family transcription regulator